ncbi:hypothetical protein GCM10028791_02150 [Echinicola sediminis]
MIASSIYKPLIKLSIHHNYFLNDGEETFFDMTDKDKNRQLELFDFGSFIRIKPTQETSRLISGSKMVFKHYKDHLLIALKVSEDDHREPYIALSNDDALVFAITILDPFFGNYTKLGATGTALMYFTNKSPDLPAPVTFEAIHRNSEAKTVNENFLFIDENKLALLEQNGFAGTAPDGLIKLHLKGDNAAMSIIQNNGKLKNNLPHFKIHFENQKTIWKYINNKAGFEVETKQEKPLTHFGFIQLEPPSDFKSPPADLDKYKFPNPNAGQVKKIGNKLYSEIFI